MELERLANQLKTPITNMYYELQRKVHNPHGFKPDYEGYLAELRNIIDDLLIKIEENTKN